MPYEGPEVFRAPVGNKTAQANFQRTVLDGIESADIAELSEVDLSESVARLWGTKASVEGTWENVSPGDFLIFYRDGTYEYAAEVLDTERNEALGREVWPNFEEDSPWVCIIHLDAPIELEVPSSEIHDLAGYDIDYPLGFAPLNEMGVGGIRGRYGSVESFVYGDDGGSAIDVMASPDFAIPEDAVDGLLFPEEYTAGLENLVGQITDALNAGKHIIFTGPPGTGKTEIARQVCTHLERSHEDAFTGYEMTTATADWSTFETVGGYMPDEDDEGNLEFNPGQILRCFKRERQRNDLLIIDEINRSDIDKSFGQLFTVLSGQGIQLPFTLDGESVEVLPAESVGGRTPDSNEFLVPSSWRIFATMNSYDKTSLYEMSYAFMRRFAFIYVEAPTIPEDETEQADLVGEYARTWDLEADESIYRDLGAIWYEMNENGDERPIGPALVRDMLAQVTGSRRPTESALTDAVANYVLPQLEGVRRRDRIVAKLASLDPLDGRKLESIARDVLEVTVDE